MPVTFQGLSYLKGGVAAVSHAWTINFWKCMEAGLDRGRRPHLRRAGGGAGEVGSSRPTKKGGKGESFSSSPSGSLRPRLSTSDLPVLLTRLRVLARIDLRSSRLWKQQSPYSRARDTRTHRETAPPLLLLRRLLSSPGLPLLLRRAFSASRAPRLGATGRSSHAEALGQVQVQALDAQAEVQGALSFLFFCFSFLARRRRRLAASPRRTKIESPSLQLILCPAASLPTPLSPNTTKPSN